MKKYQKVTQVSFDHVTDNCCKTQDAIAKAIGRYQEQGFQVEVQYSTCATSDTVVYSALILAYTEEDAL